MKRQAVAANFLGSLAALAAVAALALTLVPKAAAQPTFTHLPIAGLPGVGQSSVAWGDYDNDGRLDFILTGTTNGSVSGARSQLWRNTGSEFTNVTASVAPGLPGVFAGSVVWGDYDNDGRLDFLLTGYGGGYVSQLWQNTGNGFMNVTASVAPDLPGVAGSSVAWGDYDNDGRLDFLLTGTTSNYRGVSQLWRNTGSGFANATTGAFPNGAPPGVYQSVVAWGDYDNDGRLDFLLTGYPTNYNFVSQLWRNTGSGFTNVMTSLASNQRIAPNDVPASVAWGDYDNDGQLDFILTGYPNSSNYVSQLWRNTGGGFTNVTASVAPGLPDVALSFVAWGDFDNDGRLDLLLTGYNGQNVISQLWRNTGSGFTNVTAAVVPDLPGVVEGSLAWGDYDNDGRLDFLLTGQNSGTRISQLWHNNTPITNTPPSAPTGLALTATATAVMLSWNSATDTQTPALGLTYNVRAGSAPGGNDLLAAQVNVTNGFRRVPALGNAMLHHSLPLTGLTNGQTVYWSVQAVDTAFAGGPFAIETSVVSLPQLALTPSSSPNTLVSWSPPTWGWVLQEAANLAAGQWSNSPTGELNPAIVPATNGATFYRLINP